MIKVVPPKKRFLNECMNALCKRRWFDWPGTHAEYYDGCPGCGSLYWKPIAEADRNDNLV